MRISDCIHLTDTSQRGQILAALRWPARRLVQLGFGMGALFLSCIYIAWLSHYLSHALVDLVPPQIASLQDALEAGKPVCVLRPAVGLVRRPGIKSLEVFVCSSASSTSSSDSLTPACRWTRHGKRWSMCRMANASLLSSARTNISRMFRHRPQRTPAVPRTGELNRGRKYSEPWHTELLESSQFSLPGQGQSGRLSVLRRGK